MYNIFSVRTCIFGAIDGAVIFVRRPAAKTHFIVRMRINGIIVDDNKSAVRIRARPLPIHTKIRYNMFFLNIFFGVDPIFVWNTRTIVGASVVFELYDMDADYLFIVLLQILLIYW